MARKEVPDTVSDAAREKAGVPPLMSTEEELLANAITDLRNEVVGTEAEKLAATFDEETKNAKVESLRATETAAYDSWVDRVVNLQWAIDAAAGIGGNPEEHERGNDDRRNREEKENAPRKKLRAPPSFNKAKGKGKGSKTIAAGFVNAALKELWVDSDESEEDQPRRRKKDRKRRRRKRRESDTSSSEQSDSDYDDRRPSKRRKKTLCDIVRKDAPNDGLGAACIGYVELSVNFTI